MNILINDTLHNIFSGLYPYKINKKFYSGSSTELKLAMEQACADGKRLSDVHSLENYLKTFTPKISEMDISRMMLIATSQGYESLFNVDSNIDTFEVFVIECCERTGLLKPVIIEYVNLLIVMIGKDFTLEMPEYSQSNIKELMYRGVPGAYLLASLNRLGMLEQPFKTTKFGASEETYDIDLSDKNEAIRFLKLASDLSDGTNTIAWARKLYEGGYFELAYRFYSSSGIGAMDLVDRENWKNLSEVKKFNITLLIQELIMILVSVALICFVPSFSYYTGSIVFGSICIVLQLLVWIWSLILYRFEPHELRRFPSALIFILLMCFIIVRIIN